jgi:hypothetical protein
MLGRFLTPPGGFGGPGGPRSGSQSSGSHGPKTIEGEFRREDD